MRRTFTLYYCGRLVLELTLILVFVEGIFLAEKFVGTFETAIGAGAQLSTVFFLQMMTAPEIFDLAMPLALLIAFYRVTLRLREERELIVLASAGIGTPYLLRLMVVVAAIGSAATLIVSGFVDPLSRYAQREALFEAEHAALHGGISAGKFYHLDNYVVFARALDTDRGVRHLFLFDPVNPEHDRIITAQSSQLLGPAHDGTYDLLLRDFTANYFEKGALDLHNVARLPIEAAGRSDSLLAASRETRASQRVEADAYSQAISFAGLLRLAPRTEHREEWTLFELLGLVPSPDGALLNDFASATDKIVRVLLCLLAPFLAILALGLTGTYSQMIALPSACAGLMSVDLATSAMVFVLAGLGPSGALAALALSIILIAAMAAAALALTSQVSIFQPKLERS